MADAPKLKEVANRKELNVTAAAEPRVFLDYTVIAKYADGSQKPIGTVNNFADTEALKSIASTESLASGKGVPNFVVVERDYDETREKEKHMIESEVS